MKASTAEPTLERSNLRKPASFGDVALATVVSAGVGLGVAFLLPDEVIFAWVIAVGLLWFSLSVVSAPTLVARWSPGRVFPPILAMYSFGSIALAPDPTTATQVLTTSLAVLGFSLGSWIPLAGRAVSRTLPESVYAFTLRRAVVWTLFVAATATLAGLLAIAGTLPIFSSDPNLARTTFFTNGITSTIVVMGFQGVIVLGLGARIVEAAGCTRLSTIFLPCVSALALYSLGNRGMLVAPVVAVGLLFLWRRPLNIGMVMFGGISILVTLSLLGYERNRTSFGATYSDDLRRAGYSADAEWLAPILNYVAGTSETYSRTIALLDSGMPLQLGAQFFGPLVGAESADLFVKSALGLSFVGFGLAIGYVNAFYLDWGSIGTLAGPFVMGMAMTLIFKKASGFDARWMLVYSYLLARLVLSVYGHPFAYIYYLLLPIVLYLGIKAHRRTSSSAAKHVPPRGAIG